MNDRYIGMVKIVKISSKESEAVKDAIIRSINSWKPFLKTITSDNGKEFACPEIISEELGIPYYFAHPYCSWERGSNENINGLIRHYFPKKTNFENVSNVEIKWVEKKLNDRPRKRFNFATPNEKFIQEIAIMT